MSDSVERDIVAADYEVFRVRRLSVRSPRTGGVFDFHVIDRPRCVQMIALTGDGDVIMVEQFRYGSRSVELEFPAGVVDEGEDPAQTALRELEEETGYRAGRHALIGEILADAALHTNAVTIIAAFDCTASGQADQDESEDVRVRLIPRAEVARLIARGEIRHGLAVAAWHLFACG